MYQPDTAQQRLGTEEFAWQNDERVHSVILFTAGVSMLYTIYIGCEAHSTAQLALATLSDHFRPSLAVQRSIWVDQDLGVSLYSLIELVIRLRRIFKTALVRHDKAWFRLSSDDQIPEVSIVMLDVALSSAQV